MAMIEVIVDLLDANILADVYSNLTGGQSKINFVNNFDADLEEENKKKQEIFQMISKLLRLLLQKRINSCTLKDLKRLRKTARKHYGILK